MKTADILIRCFLTGVLVWVVVSALGLLSKSFKLSQLVFVLTSLLFYVTAFFVIFQDSKEKFAVKFGHLSVALFAAFAACGIFGAAYGSELIQTMSGISIAGSIISLIAAAFFLIWEPNKS